MDQMVDFGGHENHWENQQKPRGFHEYNWFVVTGTMEFCHFPFSWE